MTEQLPEIVLYDKRLIARHISKGLITREDVDKRLKETEDLTDQAEFESLDALMGIIENAAQSQEPDEG